MCSPAASPLAQAEERISNRMLRNPIDMLTHVNMLVKGPAER